GTSYTPVGLIIGDASRLSTNVGRMLFDVPTGTEFIWTVGSPTTTANEKMRLDTNGLTLASLTVNRIPFAGTSGLLKDNSGFTYTNTGGNSNLTSSQSSTT